MKHFMPLVLAASLALLASCHVKNPQPASPMNTIQCPDAQTCAAYASPNPQGQQQVCDFLKACGTYFIATCEGDQARVRPFGTVHIFEGKLYIQTGHSKKVGNQIAANPKVELCAFDGARWLRLSGTLVDDGRREAKASMLEAYPSLQGMYKADDPNTAVLYFTDATATIESFTEPKITIQF